METCDVLVVGLGPAGGAAALAAASAGLRVVALERRKEIGRPVQCAECVPAAMGALVRRLGCEVQRVDVLRTVLPSGAKAESVFRGILIDREKFDAGLAQCAAGAGARLFAGCRLVGLDAVAGRAQCQTVHGAMEIGYRLLVAADGPLSFVASALGLPFQPVALARQISVPLLHPLDRTEVFLSPDYPGGYAWLFPKGGAANLGVGVSKKAVSLLRRQLEILHRQLVREGRVGEAIQYRTGGAIPIGGMRSSLVVGNVIFAGDAAGVVHPITGAGIHPAVVSGEAAGCAAASWLAGDAAALRRYETGMRELFGPSLERALERRKELEAWEGGEAALRRGWVAFPEYYGRGVQA